MINFLKRKGFAVNAKWLWLMAPDPFVGEEPLGVYVPLISCLCATTLWPRHAALHAARCALQRSAAPDEVSTEGRLFLLHLFSFFVFALVAPLLLVCFLCRLICSSHHSLYFQIFPAESLPPPRPPTPPPLLLCSTRLPRCSSQSSHKPQGHSCSLAVSTPDLPM